MDKYCPNCSATLYNDRGCMHYIGKYIVEYFREYEGLMEATYISFQDKIIYSIDKLILIKNEQHIETILLLK